MATGEKEKLHKKVKKALKGDPAWQILVLGTHWLCPYCTDTIGPLAKDDDTGEIITQHLTDRCEPFSKGKSPKPHAELVTPALHHLARILVRRGTTADEVWKLGDSKRRWYCPYCGEATEVRLPGGDLDSGVLDEMAQHVQNCSGFADGQGETQNLKTLNEVIAFNNKADELAARLQQKIETDPRWRTKSDAGLWVCPFCREPIPHIDVSSSLLLFETAPGLMARHLLTACLKFEEGTEPTGTLKGTDAAIPVPSHLLDDDDPPPAKESSSPKWQEELARELREVRDRVDEAESDIRRLVQPALPPEIRGLEIQVIHQVGQNLDLHKAWETQAGDLAVLIGTVSGSMMGVGQTIEALGGPLGESMARVARDSIDKGTSPETALKDLNGALTGNLDPQIFVSCSFSLIEPTEGRLRFSRAGLPPPFLFNPARTPSLTALESGGMVMGIDRGDVFNSCLEEKEIDLLPGDLIVLFTTSLVEVLGEHDTELGTERLSDLIRKYGNHEADYVRYKVEEHLERMGVWAYSDADVTLLAIRYVGGP